MFILGYFALESDSWANRFTQDYRHLSWFQANDLHLTAFARKPAPSILRDRRAYTGLQASALRDILLSGIPFVWKRNQKVLREKLAAARKTFLVITLAAICISVICIVFVNMITSNLSEGFLLHHLVLTDSSFNDRGYIWRRTTSAIKDEPLLRKLFGNGLNSFRSVMDTLQKLPFDSGYADPHNEFLQMTMNMGLLGLIGYFDLLISTLIRGLRSWKADSFHIITVLT